LTSTEDISTAFSCVAGVSVLTDEEEAESRAVTAGRFEVHFGHGLASHAAEDGREVTQCEQDWEEEDEAKKTTSKCQQWPKRSFAICNGGRRSLLYAHLKAIPATL
jgi:hypothetical protein